MERNLRWLGVGVALRMLGNALYAPFLALFLQNVLGVGYIDIGVIFVGVGLVQLPFNYVGGLLADRLGRRRLILVGLAAEAASTAALAYAFALESLGGAIAAAAIGGTVATLSGPAASAYIADHAEGSERTRGFTWYRICFNAGYSAGVTLGGLMIASIGFAGAVAVAAGTIAVGTVFLAGALGPSPFDVRLRSGAPAPGSPRGAAAPTRSTNLVASFRVLARDRVALEVLVAVALAALVLGQWAVTFPLFVHDVLAIPYSLLGFGLALNGLVVVFGQSFTTERVVGWRHTSIAILGSLLYVVAFVGLGAAGLFGIVPEVVFFLAVLVLTFGENLVTIPQATLPSNMAPPSEVGSYNGAFAMVGAAGFLASVFVGGVVLSWTANPLLIWLLLSAPTLPSILLFRDAAHRLPRAVDTA